MNVGMPKNVQWRDKTVYTGIWKAPVEGPVMVHRLNVDCDGQGDLAGHGGEQRAVMVHQTESMTTGGVPAPRRPPTGPVRGELHRHRPG